MLILRISLFIYFVALWGSHAFANSATPSQPYQDKDLIHLLYQNKVRLIVMRHGEALHNLGLLMCSTTSPGVYLTEKGKSQVQCSANRLLAEEIDAIYASPLFRTLQTAQIVGAVLNIPYRKMMVEEDLREQFFGDFEDHTYLEYEAYFSSPQDVFTYAAPGGESGSELFSRTRHLLWQIAAKHPNETILLVTHAYNCCQISKCLTDSFKDIPEKAEFKIYDFNCYPIGDDSLENSYLSSIEGA